MLKRIFDFVLSLTGLLLLWPIFLIVALLIKIDSKGPVFFKQKRVGKDGKLFKVYKFRTMVANAPLIGSKLTRKNDTRITKIGHILRWLKIDELPQLINVLTGKMSFIGPRPEIPSVVEFYSLKERKVLSVKPGIIGPTQILHRNELEKYPDDVEDTQDYYLKNILPEKLAIDLEYIDRKGLLKDIGYLVKGILITIFGAIKVEYLMKNRRQLLLLGIDLSLSILSYLTANLLRFDFCIPKKELPIILPFLLLIPLVRPLTFIYFGLYQGLHRYVSTKDFTSILKAVSLGSLLIFAFSFLLDVRVHSRAVILLDWLLLIVFLFGLRMVFRLLIQKKAGQGKKRNALIVGAQDMGELLLREINRNPKLKLNPVGFIEDDPQMLGKVIHGVKVLGRRSDLAEIILVKNVDEVLLTISGNESREIINFCQQDGVQCRIIPSLKDIINDSVRIELTEGEKRK